MRSWRAAHTLGRLFCEFVSVPGSWRAGSTALGARRHQQRTSNQPNQIPGLPQNQKQPRPTPKSKTAAAHRPPQQVKRTVNMPMRRGSPRPPQRAQRTTAVAGGGCGLQGSDKIASRRGAQGPRRPRHHPSPRRDFSGALRAASGAGGLASTSPDRSIKPNQAKPSQAKPSQTKPSQTKPSQGTPLPPKASPIPHQARAKPPLCAPHAIFFPESGQNPRFSAKKSVSSAKHSCFLPGAA